MRKAQPGFVLRLHGTASWFASNGNDFLYASAELYTDVRSGEQVNRHYSRLV